MNARRNRLGHTGARTGLFGRAHARVLALGALGAFVLVGAACGGGQAGSGEPCAPNSREPRCQGAVAAPQGAGPVADNDPLGPPPRVPPQAVYAPPVPTTFALGNGATVWLLERHTLPIVSIAVSIPSGAADDPPGKEGLASITADMLDEGAGDKSALDLARAIDMLGASITTSAGHDTSMCVLATLKKNLEPAAGLLADIVLRPRFDAGEFRRVHDLWRNDVKMRATDPNAVAQVVSRAVVFGEGHPYSHPVDGYTSSPARVALPDVKTHYKTFWRPERAHIVVVGDVTRAEVEPLLTRAFGAWRAAPPPPELAKVPPPAAARPRLVLVDRPDAPQAVLALVRPGVAASAPEYAALTRANFALGGSFTSRLNQELREKRGFTYGARSRVAAGRETGMVVASAAVHTEVTGEAAELLLANVRDFAASGLTPEEIDKTRSQARAELVEVFEAVTSTASRFAQDAALLLPPNFQTELSTRRDQADKAALDAAVKQAYDTGAATLVVVGPAAKVEEQLRRLNLGPAERRDAEGKKLDPPKSRCEGKRC